MFKRKVFDTLDAWRMEHGNKYAVLLEGARRVGKSTIARTYAERHFRSYILVDFSNLTPAMEAVFEDISSPDVFFLRLQTVTGIDLYEHESAIIFDEIQLAPKVRQAIKHLVKDGRYFYIETGSLISIKKNVKDIVIPSEEHKIAVHPMDYEEFMWACGRGGYDAMGRLADMKKPVGEAANRSLMRDFRIYMAVGGMPQAVEAYVEGKNFTEIDSIKRDIIELYKDDFRKIDTSGRVSALFEAIPSRLALGKKRFVISNVLNKRTTSKDEELLFALLDSKTVTACYNTADPGVMLSQTRKMDEFKLYLADTGLFVTMLLMDSIEVRKDIYSKLLSNKLDANMGFLYENAVAQVLTANGKGLYYHTWRKENSTHSYEIDFLLISGGKVVPIEVKSSLVRNHASIDSFSEKYSGITGRRILFSQKDIGNREMLEMWPIYMAQIIVAKL